MNTPIEIMQAIVENGGEIYGWVSDQDGDWRRAKIFGVSLSSAFPILTGEGFFELASLHDPTNWENSLEERKQTTRPMTPREFARLIGENMGKYVYRLKIWGSSDWMMIPTITNYATPTDWLYAENVEGELEWRELPEVEG